MLHRALQRLHAFGQRQHQEEGALGHRLLGVARHVDHGDAVRAGGLDVDGVDAHAVLHDGLQSRGRCDHRCRDGRVAHQQQVGVGDFTRQLDLTDRPRQQYQARAGCAQQCVDARHFEFGVGTNNLPLQGRHREFPLLHEPNTNRNSSRAKRQRVRLSRVDTTGLRGRNARPVALAAEVVLPVVAARRRLRADASTIGQRTAFCRALRSATSVPASGRCAGQVPPFHQNILPRVPGRQYCDIARIITGGIL